MDNLPCDIRENMSKQDSIFRCTGGNHTHNVGFSHFNLRQSFDQLDHAQDQRGGQRHHHRRNGIAPYSVKNDKIGDWRNCRSRIDCTIHYDPLARASVSKEQSSRSTCHRNDGGAA